DAGRKPEVARALDRLGETLREAGLDVRVLKWEESRGKGLDDYLLNDPGHRAEVKGFLRESLTSLDHGHDQAKAAGDHHGRGQGQGREERQIGFGLSL